MQDNDDYPDILIGNRLYMSRRWVKYANKNTGVGIGATTHVTPNLPWMSLEECKAACLAAARCNAIVFSVHGKEGDAEGCWRRAVDIPVDSGAFGDGYDAYDVYVVEPSKGAFGYEHGVQIGPRDFAQVYAGDVDGVGAGAAKARALSTVATARASARCRP